MRRFEFVEGTSSKFWQVDQQGSDLQIAWGRIGTAGQSQIKSYPSDVAAASEADKLIKKKVKEGYLEKGETDAVRAGAPAAASVAPPRPKAAKAPKEKPTTSSVPKVDSKLLAAWRKAAKLVLDRGHASLHDITNKPGAWEAFAAGIDTGDIPLAAVWKFGARPMDHVSPKHTLALLAAKPVDTTDFWFAYELAIGAILLRLSVEPAELVAFAGQADPLIRELVDVGRIQAGLLPPGQASAVVRQSIEDRWTRSIGVANVAIVDGEVVRKGRGERELGDLLLGHDAFVATLAEGYRKQLGAAAGKRPYPEEGTIVIAGEGLTPDEVCGFEVRSETFAEIAKRWSFEDLERIALEKTTTFPRIAACLALLAIEREPSAASRVESALSIGHALGLGYSRAFAALTRAPTDWLRAYVVERIFARGEYLGDCRGPFGIALLVGIDPEAAESLARERAEDLFYADLYGIGVERIHALLARSGPTVARGLGLAVIVGYKNRDDAPEEVDELVDFDGTNRDEYQTQYVRTRPRARALAILRRLVANGHEAHVRSAFTNSDDAVLLAELFGDVPKSEEATPKSDSEDALEAQAKELELALAGIEGADRVAIYLLATGDDVGDSIGRVLGTARAVPKKMRPTFDGEPMAHVLTLDLDELPEVRKELGKEKFRAMALFVSDLDGHAADAPGNTHTRVVWLEPKDVKAALRASEDDEDDPGDAQRVRVRRVELPKAAFDAGGPVTRILVNSSYAGGSPAWMQDEDEGISGRFVLQFGQELVPMNLADCGVMYVFDDTAFLQSG